MKRINSWCLLIEKYGDYAGKPVALGYATDYEGGESGCWGLKSGSITVLPFWIRSLKHLQPIFNLPITDYTVSYNYKKYDVILLGVMEYREITRLLDLISSQTYKDLGEVGAWITTSEIIDNKNSALQRTIELMSKTIEELNAKNAELLSFVNIVKSKAEYAVQMVENPENETDI